MYRMLAVTIAAGTIAFASFPASALAQVATTQIMLTERTMEGFIAAQKALSEVLNRMQGTALSDQAFAKYRVEREALTKKYGFKDYAEYETVAANILIVMDGIDPQTKMFTDPRAAIQKEIEDVRADRTIASSEKKQMVSELNEALKSVQPIQYPSNIELVIKYYEKIDVTAIAEHDGDNPSTSSVVRTVSE